MQRTFSLADGRRVGRDVSQTWIHLDSLLEMTLVMFGDECLELVLAWGFTKTGVLSLIR